MTTDEFRRLRDASDLIEHVDVEFDLPCLYAPGSLAPAEPANDRASAWYYARARRAMARQGWLGTEQERAYHKTHGVDRVQPCGDVEVSAAFVEGLAQILADGAEYRAVPRPLQTPGTEKRNVIRFPLVRRSALPLNPRMGAPDGDATMVTR